MQSCGGECGNLVYLLHETAQALCTPPAAGLLPLRGARVQAADGDLAAEPRSTSGLCCVDFSRKVQMGWECPEKTLHNTKDTEKR